MIWVFIGRETGMPLDVQKCDFAPTICPAGKTGNWVAHVEERAFELLQAALRIERDTCDRYKSELERARAALGREGEE